MTHPNIPRELKGRPLPHGLFDDGWHVVADAGAQAGGETPLGRIEPRHLFEMAKQQPLQAILECQKNLSILEDGFQKQRRRYIAISYAAAYATARDEDALVDFDQLLMNQRIIKKTNPEATRGRLIYRMFEIMFAKTGLSSSNTAYRYAHGLEHYFDSGMHPNNVANMLIEHGPEKLYKEAVKRNQDDERHANMLHHRHLIRAKIDGKYAAKLLAQDPANTIRANSEQHDISGEKGVAPVDEDDDVPFDDYDDEEKVTRPSWRREEVVCRFGKMVTLAAQLSGEIAESRAVLEGKSPLSPDDYLLDDDCDEHNNWKTPQVVLAYDQLLRRAAEIGGELIELKAMLEELTK